MISRDDVLRFVDSDEAAALFESLADLTRHGYHLILTAPEPDVWPQLLRQPDQTLLGDDSIRRQLGDAGGVLDGVYYVRRSLLTQKQNREEALNDMMERFGTEPDHCHLFSSSRKFVQAAAGLGIHAEVLSREQQLDEKLRGLPR